MNVVAQVLQWIVDVLLIGLGFLTFAEWVKHRGRSRLQLALALGFLGGVVIIGIVGKAAGWNSVLFEDLSLTLFVASGYSLLLFRHTVIPFSMTALRWATAGNIVALLASFAARIPPTSSGVGLTTFQTVMVFAVIGVWSLDTATPSITFWRASRTLPAIQRARVRSLAIGYAGLIFILLVAVAAGRAASGALFQIGTESIALCLMPFLYAGISPPNTLRRWWRQREEAALREATSGLVQFAPDVKALSEGSLQWAMRLVGGVGGFIAGGKGRVLASQGVTDETITAVLATSPASVGASKLTGFGPEGAVAIVIPIQSRLGLGYLAVISGPFTPIFGADEVERLVQYARVFATGYDRVQNTQMISVLSSVVTVANNGDSIRDAATQVIELICEYTGWPAGHALFTDTEVPLDVPQGHVWSKRLERDKAYEPLRAALQDVRRQTDPASTISQVMKSHMAVAEKIRDIEGFYPQKQALAAGLKAGIWVPIRVQDESVGILEFFADEEFVADDALMQMVEAAGSALGRVFERTRAADFADKASNAKTEYLSRISHELRTPLTVIIGYTDLLSRTSSEADKSRFDAVMAASNHLLGLINDVLDISRIESRSETVDLLPTLVGDVLDQCLRLTRPAASLSSTAVERDDDVDIPPVLADAQRLVQIMVNLASNAIKYGRPGGMVRIGAEQVSARRVRMSVTDGGNGIPANKMDRLFSPFERLDAEWTVIPGTGLGLALVKMLAESMNATVGVESTVGVGSTFWVELDVAEVATKRIDSRIEALPPDEAQTAEASASVLFVDDNAATCEMVKDLIELRPGISLLTASDGAGGLDVARNVQPDLIILDVHLPDILGDEVVRRLRADPRTKEIPIVVFSADATIHQITNFRDLGVEQYLTKPIRVDEFLGTIDRYLATVGSQTR